MQSTVKNMFYNSVLMLFNIIFPLITMSYVSRILGSDNLGKINYAQSIITFLMIFATIGTELYGIREISQIREDREKLNKIFSELTIIKFFASITIFIIYTLFLFFKFRLTISNSDLLIFFLISFALIFNIFNLDWFFKGIEDYKVITFRSIAVKIVCFIGMVLFVKSKADIYKYLFLLTLGQGVGYLWSCFYSKKYVKLSLKDLNLKKHYKSLKIFFISALVISIYTTVNGIILGYFAPPKEVAFFSRARQIQGIGTTITGAITAVLIPRTSYYYKNNKTEYDKLLKKSLNYNYILSIPIMFGFIFLSKEINLFLGGREFLPASKLLVILAPLVVIITVGTWVYYQIMIPMGMEKFSTIMQTCTAIISIILNLVLIPLYKDIGASIVVVLIELFGPIFSFFILKKVKKFTFNIWTSSLPKYLIASVSIVGIIQILKLQFFNRNIITITLSIILGSLTYFIVLIIIKEEIMNEIYIFIKNKIKKIKYYRH